MSDWNAQVIEEFRANGGKVGGQFEGAPLLLLHTTGARSGVERVNPMMYLSEGGRMFVFASKAGADSHPDWYANLLKTPEVTVEVGTEEFAATATPLAEPERAEVYARRAALYPGFAGYRAKTTWVIPVLELVCST